MRTLLRVSMDVTAANRAIENGAFQTTIDSVLDRIHPESVYFTADHGRRTGFIVFDLKDVSEIPSIAEPFFQTCDAEVDFLPVMNREDLAKGLKSFHSTRKVA